MKTKPPRHPKKTEQQLADEFIAAYKKLCEQHGFILNAVPVWRQSPETGTWQTVIQPGVQRMPEKKPT